MKRLIPLLLTVGLIAACSDSDPLQVTPAPTPVPTPPPTATVDFTGFVKEQLVIDSESATPAEINDIEFEFTDLDDPDAYDDVFAEGT